MTHEIEEGLDEHKRKVLGLMDDFQKSVKERTTDSANFATISEIEQLWGELKGDTEALYSDMLSEIIAKIDESDLLRKKKLNIGRKV